MFSVSRSTMRPQTPPAQTTSCTCRGSPAPKEREVTPSEMSAFLESLVDVRIAERPLPLSAPSTDALCSPSHIAIVMALRDPTIFDFDRLFELNAVLIAQMHPLFVLWTFLSGTPDALHTWQNAHTDTSRSVHDRDLNRVAGLSTENDGRSKAERGTSGTLEHRSGHGGT
ncbi:hypothetical protein EDB85DRAFT_2293486 [Lactarius pseudohatsudake]|nr:hypothetical protein EDB85DRAFT_2293486 [Lactarius pseudohatsudake]